MYVVDDNSRIQRFDRNGRYLLEWGVAGLDSGEVNIPLGIDVDLFGNVYVADTFNRRIQKFNFGGVLLGLWGEFGSGAGEFQLPVGVSAAFAGDVYALDQALNRVERFIVQRESPPPFLFDRYGLSTPNGSFDVPTDVDTDVNGNIYVADIGGFRVVKYAPDGTYLLEWGDEESGPFSAPSGIAVSEQGHVYVSDVFLHNVQKFDLSGNPITSWGSLGSLPGEFDNPIDLDVNPLGEVFVADRNNDRVQRFDGDGNLINEIGPIGMFSFLLNPVAVAADGRNNLYVADDDGSQILRFNQDGNLVEEFGPGVTGSAPGELDAVTGITFDNLGNVLVTEANNHRVQKFDRSGMVITSWGDVGFNPGQFFEPQGLAVDGGGNVIVADGLNDRFQKFGSGTVSATSGGPVAKGLRLSPAAPNPASEQTILRFTLSSATTVSLQVFDVRGRLVRTGFSERLLSAGDQQWQWDLRDGSGTPVRAGVYWVQVRADTEVQSQKAVVLR